MKKNIAIFASGSGSNAENIYKYFRDTNVEVKYIICNNPNAGVLKRFENTNVKIVLVEKKNLSSDIFIEKLKGVDLIILAGFLLLIPENFIVAFPNRIINIHPALLPKYGGKGMYGDNVHRKVLENKEPEHGITIHYVNEEFDKGTTIFQSKFKIEEDDNLSTVKDKIHQLEMEFYPKIIEGLLN